MGLIVFIFIAKIVIPAESVCNFQNLFFIRNDMRCHYALLVGTDDYSLCSGLLKLNWDDLWA